MGPPFPVELSNRSLDEANILRPKIPGPVPQDNRLHNVLLASGERYTTLSILTPAFSLFCFQRAFFKELKCYDNLINTPEFLAAFFLLRSHSAYLGGVRLAISGQIAETYMVLRGCLEAAIYGVYLSRHKESQEVWLRRHDDEKSLKRVKEEFKIGKLLKFLESVDQRTYQIANLLYARTIDYGAHPNELALTSLISKIEENDKIQYNLPYLSKHTPAFKLSKKTTVQVGICALDIFQNVFSDRYKILGIDQELNKLKVRL